MDPHPLGLMLVGVLAGVMPGVFGFGGGWLLVPVLVTCLGVPWSLASGTVLCAGLAGASSGVASQLLRRSARRRKAGAPLAGPVAVIMVVSALFGAVVGKVLLRDRLAGQAAMTLVLDLVLLVTLLAIASRLVYEVAAKRRRGAPIEPGTMRLVALAVGGFVPGILSGLMGIGGGILFVPVLLFLLHWRQDEARALSRVAVLGAGILGTLLYAAGGGVSFTIAAWMFIPAGIIGVATAQIRFSHSRRRRNTFKLLTASFAAVAIALTVVDMVQGTAPPLGPPVNGGRQGGGVGSVALVLLALLVPLAWGVLCALVQRFVLSRRPAVEPEDPHAGWFYQI